MSKSSSKLSKVAMLFSAAVALATLAGLLAEITASPLAKAESIKSNNERMWAIYYKTEIKNPVPGTWGAEMPIMEWYYDVGSIRTVGHKKFVETTYCSYRVWKPGEPTSGSLFCRLDRPDRSNGVVGIDCKGNSFQVASGLMASPEWKAIPKDSSLSKLKSQLCGV